MLWQNYLRRTICAGILFFLLYLTLFRRRSAQVFFTASHVNKFLQEKNVSYSHSPRIPRIIHQTWKTDRVPSNWNVTVQSVRQHNANQFEYRLWTDEQMHQFVRQVEPDLYQHTFRTYSLDIQRVDAFRYVILYHLGGLYIDMDNGCQKPFESLLKILETLDASATHLAAFPHTSPVGISNGFMISTKGHPLFKILISRLSLFDHNYLIDYFTVMFSAGPTYLSINEFYFDQSSTHSAIRIIDNNVYSHIYTWHTPGNSWHGKDAQIVLYIYHTLRLMSPGRFYQYVFLLSCIVVLLLYRLRSRRRRKKH